MNLSPRITKSRRRLMRTGMALLLALLLVACSAVLSRPRQGWNPAYGPVVPHDTFPADCALCHAGGDWNTLKDDFVFDHEKQAGVALNGAHAQAQCLLCHNDRGPVRDFAAKGCAGCHEDVHQGNLGHMCSNCHTEDTWKPIAIIAQHNRTRFPLVGAHTAVGCFRCHPGAQVANFEGAVTECEACHQDDLARAVVPDHAAEGWTSDCEQCHISVSWAQARFAHPASFPLAGGHGGHDCATCHIGGVFSGLSTDCVSCHQDDYAQTTNPNHASSSFSTNCRSCHNTNSWQGANFNHPGSFPLNAGHGGLACSQCHSGGVYTGLSTACYSCHADDYQSVTSPNHVTSGFSHNCRTCHTRTTWQGATFNHPFPISGPHNVSCSQCHLNAGNQSQFSCTHCHAHRESEMIKKHSGVGGFVWSSPACLNCHPNGTH